MAREVKLPKIGESNETGVVLSVLVSPGDRVEKDQPILELETDKATTEVPCPEAGTVEKVLVEKGDEVEGGQAVLALEEDGEDSESSESESSDAESESEEGADSKSEGGPEEERGREATDEETDDEEQRDEDDSGDEERADAERDDEQESGDEERADAEREDEAPEGEGAEDGGSGREETAGGRRREEGSRDAPSARRTKREEASRSSRRPRKERAPRLEGTPAAPPHVRRLARELGVDVDDVAGTGTHGEVGEDDVKSHVRELVERARESGLEQRPQLPDFERWGEVEREPLGRVRRAVSRSVSRSWEIVPHVTQWDAADVTRLDEFREHHASDGEDGEEGSVKLTMTAIVLKVTAAALRRYPRLNASLDPDRDEMILKRYVHVGVAVDTEDGLLVPVVRDVDRKDLVEVARELADIARRARERRVSRDDLEGASFSLTNLGGLGTTSFTPVVPWPQVGILSVGRARTEAVHGEDGFEPRLVLPLGITYDHRAVDGADAARFLRWIAETLEHPLNLAMG